MTRQARDEEEDCWVPSRSGNYRKRKKELINVSDIGDLTALIYYRYSISSIACVLYFMERSNRFICWICSTACCFDQKKHAIKNSTNCVRTLTKHYQIQHDFDWQATTDSPRMHSLTQLFYAIMSLAIIFISDSRQITISGLRAVTNITILGLTHST